MKLRQWIFRLGALAVILAVAALMFVVGRGHTVYFDSKAETAGGKEVAVPYKIEVVVDGEKAAKLYEGERGMASTMGQDFKMRLDITQEKGGNKKTVNVGMKLPYSMDGIVLNLPAMLAGLPQEEYLSEFIPVPSAEELEDEEVVTDEFGDLTGGSEDAGMEGDGSE